jgi:hypothetical protein
MPMRIALAVLFLVAAAGAASAQNRSPVAPDSGRGVEAAVDVSRLPVSLDRIRRGLQQATTVREERDGLNLRYFVEVWGQAPPLQILDPRFDNLVQGPVPYGGPTHQEILNLITPREYRAPAADVGALLRWLVGRSDEDK